MQPLRLEPRDFVAAHLYETEDAVVQAALRQLLHARPDLGTTLAVYRYNTDATLTLAAAAALAGVSLERMKDELLARGVEPRLGPSTLEEARAERAVLKRSLHAPSD